MFNIIYSLIDCTTLSLDCSIVYLQLRFNPQVNLDTKHRAICDLVRKYLQVNLLHIVNG